MLKTTFNFSHNRIIKFFHKIKDITDIKMDFESGRKKKRYNNFAGGKGEDSVTIRNVDFREGKTINSEIRYKIIFTSVIC